ncbi:MAG: restriction endonuclease subunit R [Spirulina sp. DLM2.Bin59]|nr:MAG: restriction endonuclease subunit R [Spirulina sp. DLM2.Bin59]
MLTRTARTISLQELEEQFHYTDDRTHFPEWYCDLPDLTIAEQERCDRIKLSYTYLLRYPPLLENTVKLVVLSPLLDLAGFFLPPFRVQSETATAIVAQDQELEVTGNLDVLVLWENLWILVIESKQAAFSLEVGRSQLLAYLLANPNPTPQPRYGMLTNGANFLFIKLIPQPSGFLYTYSDEFSLRNHDNGLYPVLQILKAFAHHAKTRQP